MIRPAPCRRCPRPTPGDGVMRLVRSSRLMPAALDRQTPAHQMVRVRSEPRTAAGRATAAPASPRPQTADQKSARDRTQPTSRPREARPPIQGCARATGRYGRLSGWVIAPSGCSPPFSTGNARVRHARSARPCCYQWYPPRLPRSAWLVSPPDCWGFTCVPPACINVEPCDRPWTASPSPKTSGCSRLPPGSSPTS